MSAYIDNTKIKENPILVYSSIKSLVMFLQSHIIPYTKKQVRAFTGVLRTSNYCSMRFRDMNVNIEGDINQTVYRIMLSNFI